jgi:hypothetical protein
MNGKPKRPPVKEWPDAFNENESDHVKYAVVGAVVTA